MRKYLAEFFGTMFLVLLACGSAVLAGPQIGVLGIGLCFGLVLLCLCYAIGGISGCHVNPAVSIAMYLTDSKFSGKDLFGYIVAQLLGAAVGAAFLFWIMDFADFGVLTNPEGYNFGGITNGIGDTDKVSYLATNVLQPHATWAMGLMAEILLTFFFVFVILGATSKWGNSNLSGVAIGLALGLVNIVGIPVDNCSVNPARSFGPALFAQNAWPDFWIMVVGPIVGAILAAIVWKGLTAGKEAEEA
jgi:aquaporin Z